MALYLQIIRRAFRTAYGLPDDGTVHASEIPDGLFEFARQHRILGLLQSGLDLSSLLDGDARGVWQRAVFGQANYSSYCTAEAEKLLPLLAERTGYALLLKGPALAKQAWPDIALRHFDDLDVRIPRGTFIELDAVLRGSGYKPQSDDARRQSHLWHYGWGVAYKNDKGLIIEVNHRLFPPQYPSPAQLDPDRISRDSILLDHRTVTTLTPADHLAYSCLHALWHGWERLSWIVDIAGLMVRQPAALDEARKKVHGTGFAAAALEAGTGIASELFGSDLPAANPDRVPARCIETAIQRFTGSVAALSPVEQRSVQFQLMSAREKLNYTLRRAFIPGDGDFRAWSLPSSARALYWVTRPIRAISKST